MLEDLWFDVAKKVWEENGILKYNPPMEPPAGLVVYPFGPYLDGDWHFRTCLMFSTTNTAARQIYAMTSGSVFFLPGQNNKLGKLILKRGDLVGITLTRAIGMLPSWYPQPAYITYENVDAEMARLSAVAAFSTGERAKLAVERLKKKDPQFIPSTNSLVEQLADLWMKNQLPDGLFVLAGEKIGGCGPDTTGTAFSVEVRMVDTVDPIPTLFYNPCYFFALWEEMGWMQGPDLLPEMKDTSGPPAGNGVLKVVGGSDFPSISQALATSASGDTILLPKAVTYFDEVIIDKPINLIGVGKESAKSDPTDYPILDGKLSHRPITIKNVNTGIAYVGKLIVEKGWATGDREDGGGILVERSDHVVISSCIVRNCNAPGLGLLPVIIPETVFGEGFGGGIAAYHSSPAIIGCVIENNRANARGKGIGIFGYGWPTIVETDIRKNQSFDFGGNSRHDGGGIGIQIGITKVESIKELYDVVLSQLKPPSLAFDQAKLDQARENYIRIVGSEIVFNTAWDDGGGIYMTCASKVILRNTDIRFNKASFNGGGVRVTFGSVAILQDCKIIGNESQADKVGKNAGGGGIAARNAVLVDLRRTLVTYNTANGWAGGGISFVTTDEGALVGGWAGSKGYFDWNNFLWDEYIYNYSQATLKVDAESFHDFNKATKLDTQIKDHGKGGGIYSLRWVGKRNSGLPPPQNFSTSDGEMVAWPANIYIFSADVLLAWNEASYKELDGIDVKHSNQLYVEDMVLHKNYMDEDIKQNELFFFL